MKTFASISLTIALTFTAACKKKEEAKPTEPTPAGSGSAVGSGSAEPAPTPDQGSGSAAAAEPAGSGSAAAPADPAADYISVFANHHEPKPGDPVEVKFQKFAVTKSAVKDPKNLEGATATIEVDISAISSGSDKRDGHIKADAYLDLAKFATGTIDVSNVKKKDDTHYTADAKVDFHGASKTYPVEFEVVEATADSVKVKAAHKFPRADFNVGKEPGPEESVAKELELKLQLTFKKA